MPRTKTIPFAGGVVSTRATPAPRETARPVAAEPGPLALTYGTANLGDDVQTVAALDLVARHDARPPTFVDRDRLARFRGRGDLLLNGWWAHGEEAFPPPEPVRALPIAIHVYHRRRRRWADGRELEWLRARHVGARDLATLAWLREQGVSAWDSGCLTLTFPPRDEPRDGIVGVDVPPEVRGAIDGASHATHGLSPADRHDPRRRIALARAALDRYARAELVVTTRLHAALPAAAMGTPAILLRTHDEGRLDGAERFVTVLRRDEWPTLRETVARHLDAPPDRRATIDVFASRLRTAVDTFFGDAPAALPRPSALDPRPLDVAIAFDERLVERARATIRSAAAHSSRPLVWHVLTRGVDEHRFARFAESLPGVDLRQHAMDGRELAAGRLRLQKHITVSTMDRLFLPSLLPDVERVVYLDVDTVVLGDLADLCALPTGECGIAARPGTYPVWAGFARATGADVDRLRTLAGGDARDFNAGVLLLDLAKLRAEGMQERCLRFVAETGCNDQIALAAYSRDRFHRLPSYWNTWLFRAANVPADRQVGILHWAGSRKPWSHDCLFRDLWRRWAGEA